MKASRCGTVLCYLTVPLSISLWACGVGSIAEEADEVASVSEELTVALPANATDIMIRGSVTLGGCRYSAGTATLTGPPFPPIYIGFVQRTAVGPLCPPREVYQVVVERSYDTPDVSIANGAGPQLAFAAGLKPNISGSSPWRIEIARLRPLTLTTLATSTIMAPRAGTNPPNAGVWLGSIVFTVPGDLIVTGTKIGSIPGELGLVGGGSFQATYADFASSITMDALPTQVLAW